MNYFNYFTEIEDTFIRRRGKHLLLSPLDWAMIEGWQERNIPLHIVLRGIETVFDNFQKNPQPRSIKGLMFCREEIEAQYIEWLEMQTGSNEGNVQPIANEAYSTENIKKYILASVDQLKESRAEHLKTEIERAISRLVELSDNITDNMEQTDGSLGDIEKMLDIALMEKTDKIRLKQLERIISDQLKQAKATMDKEEYERTFRLMLLKMLRDETDIPRLGLFYI